MTLLLAVSFAPVEFLACFQRGALFQVVDPAKCRDGNVEPVGDIALGIAGFYDIEVFFLEFPLHVIMRGRNLFL